MGESAGLAPVWLDRGGFGVSGFSPKLLAELCQMIAEL